MRKLLISLMFCLFCSTAMAAGPAIEEGNMIQFTAADQETAVTFTIKTIVWTSVASSEVGADDGFLLEDGAGNTIISDEATTLKDQFIVTIPDGITVSGLKAEDLDAGHLFIYGTRR